MKHLNKILKTYGFEIWFMTFGFELWFMISGFQLCDDAPHSDILVFFIILSIFFFFFFNAAKLCSSDLFLLLHFSWYSLGLLMLTINIHSSSLGFQQSNCLAIYLVHQLIPMYRRCFFLSPTLIKFRWRVHLSPPLPLAVVYSTTWQNKNAVREYQIL